MKIYRKVVIDKNGKTVSEDSYEYGGPMALCLAPVIIAALIGAATTAASAYASSSAGSAAKAKNLTGPQAIGDRPKFEGASMFGGGEPQGMPSMGPGAQKRLSDILGRQ